jgi:membrane protein DedA with SNARE-associated domain
VHPLFAHWIGAYGVPAIFVLLLLGVFGLPVPDETLLTFAGVLVREGRLALVPTVVAAVLGAMGGVSISYGIGRTFGLELVLHYGRWVHLRRAHLDRAHAWFEHAGRWFLMFGYFIPGVRHFTALVAGSSEMPLPAFARFAYGGAAIWSLTFIALGWYVGARWESVLAAIHSPRTILLVAVVLAGAYVVLHYLRRSRGKA